MNIATKNITVQPATAMDWRHVVRLMELNALGSDELKEPRSHFLLAWSEGQAVGVVGAEKYGDNALIRVLSIDKPHQGSGVGKQLLEQLLGKLRQEGLRRAYVFTVSTPEYFSQFKFKRMPHEQAPAALRASPEFQRACSACTALMSLPLSSDQRSDQTEPSPSVGQTASTSVEASTGSTQAASPCCAPAPQGKASCCGPSSQANAANAASSTKPSQSKCC